MGNRNCIYVVKKRVGHILIFLYGLLIYCQITLKVLISIIKQSKW